MTIWRTLVRVGTLTALLAGCGGSCGQRSAPAADASAETGDGAVAAREAVVDAGAPGIPRDLNVVVISIDSLRADMPWSGYERPIAPRLTELEKRAVSYTRAYAISSYTSMSLGGFLGGKLPSEMKRSGFFFGKYPDDDLMFPEVLQKNGIQTIAGQAHGYFNNAGFQQGFDKYEVVSGIVFKNETDPNITSPLHEALAEKLLADPKERFFAWFHFLDPHDMYMSHEKDGIPAYGRQPRDRYDAEVTYTDRYVGKLLDFIAEKPWAKRTAIVVTADHGEAFGEHGLNRHGFELWENLVRVPLFFVVPGVAPRHIDTPRSAIDLAPTICELLGVAVDPAAGFEGKSLVPELLGGETEARDIALDLPMTSDNDKRRALIHGDKKIIAFGKEETLKLFDLAADPNEEHPIQRGDEYVDMAARYRQLSKAVEEVAPYACGAGCLNRQYVTKDAASE